MEYVAFVFGIFGLVAFLEISSLKGRIRSLEAQLRSLSGTDYAAEKQSLIEAAKAYIGQTVRLSFSEDEKDPDAVLASIKMGTCTLLDVDENWLLVHIVHNKSSKDKLIRVDSVTGISL
ncbi:MAG: hypothetical protein E7426_03245 [Ruminococcaceae bacterium]|jgi:hypothetical protein|nr:hypothetical protein [Oscillospiraceae bacterium]